MNSEFMITATKVLVIGLTIATMVSPFSFRSGGLITGTITRKTVIVISTCFLCWMFSIWIALSQNNPSQSISALTCLGGVAVIPCTYLLLLYLRLPRIVDRHHKVFSDMEKAITKNKDDPETTSGLGTSFDNPYDNYWINFGYWFQEQHGADFGSLTPGDLAEGIDTYIEENGEPPDPYEK